MKEIDLADLESTLAASPSQKHAVYITVKDCSDCTANENILNNAFASTSEIKWYKIYVTEETPFSLQQLYLLLFFLKAEIE